MRYRTAEMADAMLGSGALAEQPVLLSAVPAEASGGPAGACDGAAAGDACGPAGSGAAQPREQPVLEPVLPAAAEEQNGTDSARAPKVSCEERNTTGIDRFTLQILNVSQVSASVLCRCGRVRVVADALSVCCFQCMT